MAKFFQNVNVSSEKHSALNGVLIVLAGNKKKRDKEDIFVVLLTNLSNVFWLFLHNLLIAELHVFGFDMV